MQINVTVQDANNIVCEVVPPQPEIIVIDRGVEGNGIVSIVPVTISTFQYLRITYTNGTVQDVGPLTSTAYTATAPITIVGNTISLATVPIASGGTDATTAAGAIQNLLPSYTGNANKRLGLNSGGTALEWVTDGGGTVTSVNASGGTTGLTFSGGPITSSGTLTLSGTLAVANGGTGVTTSTGTGSVVLSTSPSLVTPVLGTPTSVTLTNATGLPLTTGVTGTLPIANGGTGQITANAAFNALAPSQTGQSGKYLTTDGTNTSWATNPLGTVTSVAATVPSFLSVSGSPITTSGTLAFGLSGTALPTTSGGTGLTSFTSGGVVYASSSSALATSANLSYSGTQFIVSNTGATTGPTVSSFAINGNGGNNFAASFSAIGETYSINNASAKYQYFQAGTVASISATSNGVNSGALIDFNAYNASLGATGVFLGAVAGPTANGAANFVIGRRTAASNWAESLRIDTSGNLGINTNSPAYRLDVRGTGYFATASGTNQLTLGDSTNGTISALATSNSNLIFYADGSSESMRVNSTGLSIGTSSVSGKLTVANTYTNTSDATIVASSSIPGINLRTPSTGRFSIFSSYNANNSTSFLVGTGTSNPSTVAMYFDHTTGNVGIGTTSPSAKLDVVANDTVMAYLRSSGGLANDKRFTITSGGNRVILDSSNNSTGSASDFAFTLGASEQMRLTTTGLGIGTSSPSYPLDVVGSSMRVRDSGNINYVSCAIYGGITLGGNGAGTRTVQTASTDALTFGTNSTERARITSSGQVLIGTATSPTTSSQIPLVVSTSGAPAIKFYSNNSASMAGTSGITTTTYGDSKYCGYQLTSNGSGMFTNSSTASTNYISGSSGVVFGYLNQDPFENASATFTEYARINSGGLNLPTPSSGNANVSFNGSTFTLVSNSSSASMVFSTNSTERARIDASGNFMIGGTSASGKLTLTTAETKGQNATPFVISSNDSSNAFQLIVARSTNSAYRIQAVEQGVAYRTLALQADGGFLGIGRTNPSYLIDGKVSSSATNVNAFQISNDVDASVEVYLKTGATTICAGGSANLVFATGSVTERARFTASNGSMSIGTTSSGPSAGLRVSGGINPERGIVNTNIIAGFVSLNYTGTRYWLLHNMTGNPASAFNCMGDVHASSYTTWNLCNLYIRREYNTYNVYGAITGVIKNGVTVSIVDISYSSSRYVAIKFAGGDPGIEANLIGYLMDQMYTNGTDASFINGTTGVTENAVIASY